MHFQDEIVRFFLPKKVLRSENVDTHNDLLSHISNTVGRTLVYNKEFRIFQEGKLILIRPLLRTVSISIYVALMKLCVKC